MSHPVALAVALAATSSCLVAQTYVVDAANGPGTNFTSLPTAVAAVPDGAILLVRPGSYGPVQVTGKGLSVLATAPGVVIDGLLTTPVRVAGLAARQAFTLRGVSIGDGGGGASDRIELAACAGEVLLQGVSYVSTQPNLYAVLFPTAVHADACAEVTLRDCTLRAYQGLYSHASAVMVEACTLDGTDAFSLPHAGTAAGRGLVVEGGTVTLARCQVRGGDGLVVGGFIVAPAPAVEMFGGEMRLCEDASSGYTAGQMAAGAATPAVGGLAGTVVRTPDAVLAGSNGGPSVAATLTDVVRPLPSLHTVPAPPGGTVTVDVTTPLGELVLLVLALPGPVLAVPGIDGSLWVDGATALLYGLGTPQPAAPVVASVPVPNLPGLLAARFRWQALAFSSSLGLRAGNASTYAH